MYELPVICTVYSFTFAAFFAAHEYFIYPSTIGVVSTLARNVKTCVLRLCPDRACFVIVERGPTGGSNIWCELTQVNTV